MEGRKTGDLWDSHLYVNDEGKYWADLNKWETPILTEELDRGDVEIWWRNPPRKPWSFTVPYEMDGSLHPLYPDFLMVRNTQGVSSLTSSTRMIRAAPMLPIRRWG